MSQPCGWCAARMVRSALGACAAVRRQPIRCVLQGLHFRLAHRGAVGNAHVDCGCGERRMHGAASGPGGSSSHRRRLFASKVSEARAEAKARGRRGPARLSFCSPHGQPRDAGHRGRAGRARIRRWLVPWCERSSPRCLVHANDANKPKASRQRCLSLHSCNARRRCCRFAARYASKQAGTRSLCQNSLRLTPSQNHFLRLPSAYRRETRASAAACAPPTPAAQPPWPSRWTLWCAAVSRLACRLA